MLAFGAWLAWRRLLRGFGHAPTHQIPRLIQPFVFQRVGFTRGLARTHQVDRLASLLGVLGLEVARFHRFAPEGRALGLGLGICGDSQTLRDETCVCLTDTAADGCYGLLGGVFADLRDERGFVFDGGVFQGCHHLACDLAGLVVRIALSLRAQSLNVRLV